MNLNIFDDSQQDQQAASIPNYLKKAKKVEIEPSNEQPSYLKKAKKVQNEVIPFEGENDLDREIERNTSRLTSRGVETVAGLAGDLESFGRSIFGLSENNILPTSNKLKQKAEEISPRLKPQNEFEEKTDEFLKDVISLSIPGGAGYGMVRNIGIPIVANLVKEGLNFGGAEESAQSSAKIGTMIALDLLSGRKGGAKKYASNFFQEAEKAIPENAMTSTRNLNKSLENLETSLRQGGTRPTTTAALQKLKEIKDDVAFGSAPVKNLIEYRKAINEIVDSLGGFNAELPPKLKKRAVDNLNKVKSEIIKSTEEYGAKNPEFLKPYKQANEAYAAYEKSNVIANFIDKTIGVKAKHPVTKAVLGLAPVGALGGAGHGLSYLGLGSAAVGGGLGLLGTAGYSTFKIAHRMFNSPTLRKYYTNILTGALSGNASQVSRNTKALDQALTEIDDSEE